MDRMLDTTTKHSAAPEDRMHDEDTTILNFCLIHERYVCGRSHSPYASGPSKGNSDLAEAQGVDNPFNLDLNLEDNTLSPAVEAVPSGRVRFRSRVRIASGLNRHRASLPLGNGSHSAQATGEASLSSSPSSSISAPLRTPVDDEHSARPGWGPLGQRVSLFACRGRARRRSSGGYGPGDAVENEVERQREKERRDRRRRRLGLPPSLDDETALSAYAQVHGRGEGINERAPLLSPAIVRPVSLGGGYDAVGSYDNGGDEYDSDGDCEYEARLSSQIDRMFGPLPGRLLNHHWWWWQLEPMLHCHCSDDPDVEI